MLDEPRLRAAYEHARRELLSQRVAERHWVGCLSTSALSTATAASALALCRAKGARAPRGASLTPWIEGALSWLEAHQNADGGWGDTERSYSNVATTMLVRAAFHLAGAGAAQQERLRRAEAYLVDQGGTAALRRRYGPDKTFAVPILTNCALAGLVSWDEVSPLPFELACVPQSLYRFLRLPVVSYAIPALVAIGQARYVHRPPWDPLRRFVRAAAVEPSLRVLERMQPASGGYLEAVPLTSFVLMSLASLGRVGHPVSRRALEFLTTGARADGSWPIDTNLATWNTTLAINALASGGDDVSECVDLDWLLSCQHRVRHPFTGADPGGWGWSDLSGAVPDADDTAGALLALASLARGSAVDETAKRRIGEAAVAGTRWLVGLQNADGGWPTFCRGWGRLPFDRSGADLTAHALRALCAWRSALAGSATTRAIERGVRYLERVQRTDGSWLALWFGNQDHPHEENPVYGTARVLLALAALQRGESAAARRGLAWLAAAQNADGGWGGGAATKQWQASDRPSSVEETALAVEALLPYVSEAACRPRVERGLGWLVEAVERGRWQECSPIGFYFAKLWYYEKLYPVTFAVSALGQAVRLGRHACCDAGALSRPVARCGVDPAVA